MGRNTALLKEIIAVLDTELDDPKYGLDQLDSHLHDALLMTSGNSTFLLRPVSPVAAVFSLGWSQEYFWGNVGATVDVLAVSRSASFDPDGYRVN